MSFHTHLKKRGFRLALVTYTLAISCLIVAGHENILPEQQHYTVNDGLSDNHVQCFLQDKKGFMWFGTFNGLNKFDGYKFTTFKGRDDQKYKLANSRIDNIVEDKQGYLWIETNDEKIYRFDPKTENFLPVPQSVSGYENDDKPLNKITTLKDGSIWLFNGKNETQNCFHIQNETERGNVLLDKLSLEDVDCKTQKILFITQDSNSDTWLLLSKGLKLLRKGHHKLISIKIGKGSRFVCSFETNNGIYFGGHSGMLLYYDKTKKTFRKIETAFTSDILGIDKSNDNNLLLLTNAPSFYKYDVKKNIFHEYDLDFLKKNKVKGWKKDSKGMLWIVSDKQGAVFVNPKTYVVKNLSNSPVSSAFSQKPFFSIMENASGQYILTSDGGFFKYNSVEEKLEPLLIYKKQTINLSNLILQSKVDKQGNLWLNTYLQGIDKIVFKENCFYFTKIVNTSGYNSQNEIRSIFEDSHKRIWVAGRNGKIHVYDSNRTLLGYLGSTGKINGGQALNAHVYGIMEDSRGNLWFASKGNGIYKLVEKSTSHFSISNYTQDINDKYSINSNLVYSIFEDHKHRLWVGTFKGGINLMEIRNGKTIFLNNQNTFAGYPKKSFQNVRFLTEDKYGQILTGTTDGLLVVKPADQNYSTSHFFYYQHHPQDKYSLSGNDVFYIFIHKNGDIFLSTANGVDKIKAGFIAGKTFSCEPLLGVDKNSIPAVYTICSDSKDNLWMSSQTQIYRYHLSSKELVTFVPNSDENYFFDEASYTQTHYGEIIYGTSNGFIAFNPLKVKRSSFVPQIHFTAFSLFNQAVFVGAKNAPLQKTIDETPILKLNHKQNTFSIEFAAIDYINSEAINYAYKMDGLDANWNYVGHQRTATYLNVPKGKYVFRVKSTNSDGVWVENERMITIIKEPSFWESAWGFVFYVILSFLLIGIITYILFTIYKLKNEVNVEQRISDMKLKYFTDISHELRTPLTLISSPVEFLLANENLPLSVKSHLEVIHRNTERMLRLINQILDFRKVQNNKMKLVLERVYIHSFIEEICTSFLKLAEEKNIDLIITNHLKEKQFLWVDKDKFEKIIFNLLSNSFKFTASGKKIEILLDDSPEDILISIIDEGVGIGKDMLKYLFNRYESIANSSAKFRASTGIGLSLTKELIELHRASINVESIIEQGTVFRIGFKKEITYYQHSSDVILMDSIDSDEKDKDVLEDKQEEDSDKKKILLVEDNKELKDFMTTILSQTYEILQAGNGVDAMKLILKENPELILSDIMMPDMDGLEFANRVKKDISISHIPLILLTAKVDLESKLQALSYGVDDYITKPFSINYLMARIENLLKQRIQLQDHFKALLSDGVITVARPELQTVDETFLKMTMDFIEKNYTNSEMNIEDIAVNIGVSRSSFFKKLKSLTGYAPIDFVREFRMQKAGLLLNAGHTNISQIAYAVGMNDPRYFSKCFKLKYNMTPSEYKKKAQNEVN